ncbi:MAG: hypothetical protein ACRD9Y_17970 [Blastocatellia bacterium]
MSRFDDELKLALRREEPSADFAGRVMARIAELSAESKREKSREKASWLQRLAEFFQPPQMKWAMAGAMAVALIVAGVGVLRYRENDRQRMLAEIAEGEKAKEQVMMAMRIASSKLNIAQKKINETTEREPDAK